MVPSHSSRKWLLVKYSGLYFLEKSSWGNKPRPADVLFCWFSWQNRSHYLVYPHGNLTVYRVTYIFFGLRRRLAAKLRGSQKFAWYDWDKSLMPRTLWIRGEVLHRHDREECQRGRHIGAITCGWCLTLTCTSLEFIKGLALLHHIVFPVRYGGLPPPLPPVPGCCVNSLLE